MDKVVLFGWEEGKTLRNVPFEDRTTSDHSSAL